MKKLATICILIALIITPAQAQDLKAENAILRNALAQALDKLAFYQREKRVAQNQINGLERENQNARSTIAKSITERAALNRKIEDRNNTINSLKSQIAELEKKIVDYQKEVTRLKSELKSEKKKKNTLKWILIFAIPLAVVGGAVVGSQE